MTDFGSGASDWQPDGYRLGLAKTCRPHGGAFRVSFIALRGAPRRDSSRRSPLKFLVGEPRSAGGKRDDSAEALPTAASGGFMRPALCPRTGSQAGGVLTLGVSRGNMTMTCACDSWMETEKRSRSGVPRSMRKFPLRHPVGHIGRGPVPQAKGLEDQIAETVGALWFLPPACRPYQPSAANVRPTFVPTVQ
jgi:hypothetical protein